MNRWRCRRAVASFALLGVLFFAAGACHGEGDLIDGIYNGEHSDVEASVTIKNGKIVYIKMTRHGGDEETAAKITPLICQMIANQSTEVDAVPGATVLSENLMKAVENALQKAR